MSGFFLDGPVPPSRREKLEEVVGWVEKVPGYFSCPVEGALYIQCVDWGKAITNYLGGVSDNQLQFPVGVTV